MDNLSLFISIPASVAFFIPIVSRKFRWFPDMAGTVTTFVVFLLSLLTLNHETVYKMGGWPAPYGIADIPFPTSATTGWHGQQ